MTAPRIGENEIKTTLLRDILRSVSRSFYLTLSVAPPETRQTLGIAYLFCRAADTIADTELLPQTDRLAQLMRFREQFLTPTVRWDHINELIDQLVPHQGSEGERALMSRLGDCFHLYLDLPEQEQQYIRELVTTLTCGMAMDLTTFPGHSVQTAEALPTLKETDQYCYYVAGCVGEFWTRLHRHHFPALGSGDPRVSRRASTTTASVPCDELSQLAVHFGKGLQLTNLLKDIRVDLQRGRCYIPNELLATAGLSPQLLADPSSLQRLRPVLHQLIRLTIDHLDQGWHYIRSLPTRPLRLRLACAWPHLLALKTLRLVASSDQLLQLTPLKITRASVYRTLAISTLLIGLPTLLNHYQAWLRHHLLQKLGSE